jgi:hypothetical protein
MSDENWVSYDEQKEQGLIRAQRTFVPPAPKPEPLAKLGEVLPPAQPIHYEMDSRLNITPTATQHVEHRTDPIKRAQGFKIVTREMGIVYGAAMVGLCWAFAGVPLLSVPALIIFITIYSITWGFAYFHTLQTSAEGVSLYEAKGKVKIVKSVVDAQVRQFELDKEQARMQAQQLHEQALLERREDRKRRLQ